MKRVLKTIIVRKAEFTAFLCGYVLGLLHITPGEILAWFV